MFQLNFSIESILNFYFFRMSKLQKKLEIKTIFLMEKTRIKSIKKGIVSKKTKIKLEKKFQNDS